MIRFRARGLAMIGGLTLSLPVHAQTLRSFWRNRQGVKHLADKMVFPAQQDFVRALVDDPLNPAVHLNLGLTYEANEEWEKAEQADRGVKLLTKPDSAINYEATFNLAAVLGRQKKLDEAVANYQDCLRRTPESIEVKTNIELLFQGGGGEGGKDGKDKDNKSDNKKGKGQGKDDKKDPRTNQQKREQAGEEPKEKPKPQPKPFDSKDMSQEDVRRILDEIKNQEQAIRANEYEKNAKEAPQGKDW